MPELQAPHPSTHHPAEPQAGLTGSADGDAGRGHVRGRLQRLDDPRGLTEGPGADDVHLPHSEPAGRGDTGKRKETKPHANFPWQITDLGSSFYTECFPLRMSES